MEFGKEMSWGALGAKNEVSSRNQQQI